MEELKVKQDCQHERIETIDFDTVILCMDCGHEEVIQ